ncbi:MAG: FadR family transcriptional regulator, partial [Mycobacterium sp.]
LDAICDGNAARAVRLAQDHLAAARRNTLAVGSDQTIEAKLMSDLGPRLVPRSTYNGRPQSREGSST